MRKTFVKIFLTLVASAACVLPVQAQSRIHGSSVKREGRKVAVSFKVDTDVNGIPTRRKEILMPFLYNRRDTVWLSTLEVYGKQHYKKERQEQALSGNRDWTLTDGQVRKGDTLTYFCEVPYRRWMEKASLSVRHRIVGCNCSKDRDPSNVTEDVVLYVPPVPVLADEKPRKSSYKVVDADRKWNFGEDELKVIYRVSKVELRDDIFDNRRTLERIVDAVEKINADELKVFGRIAISGYASPEGRYEFNDWLGRNRAKALMDFIIKECPLLGEKDFEITNGVENWNGLAAMVEASDMEGKEDILKIIRENTGGRRKRMLKAYGGGKPYEYMLREFYPVLRNACYIAVYYDTLGDVVADAVNVANAMIRDGHHDEALKLLTVHKEDSRTWNSIGVCYMMGKKDDAAKEWFLKAMDAGCAEARENYSQIDY